MVTSTKGLRMSAANAQKDRFSSAAEEAAASERAIQQHIELKAKAHPKAGEKQSGAMQAGARRYPEPPFPKQHHA